jgi:RimJ/RimL family protein N-acetyltransferase
MSDNDKNKVYLKKPSQDDVLGYVRLLWSDDETMKDVGGTHVMDDQQAKRWFATWIEPGKEDRRYFLIMRKEDDAPVGEACFHSYNPDTRMAICSMNIEAKYRGNGYAKEALEQLLRFYFDDFGGEVIVDDIDLDNKRAQQVFLKFGFEHDPSLSKIVNSVGGDHVFWVRMDKWKFQRLYGCHQ